MQAHSPLVVTHFPSVGPHSPSVRKQYAVLGHRFQLEVAASRDLFGSQYHAARDLFGSQYHAALVVWSDLAALVTVPGLAASLSPPLRIRVLVAQSLQRTFNWLRARPFLVDFILRAKPA